MQTFSSIPLDVIIKFLSLIVSIFALLFTGTNFLLAKKQAKRTADQMEFDRAMKTLEYVTDQFDRLASMGARIELSKTGTLKIKEYLERNYSTESEQLLLEYVYTFNRIGAGIFSGALDETIIFNIWAPSFFMDRWEKFKTFVKDKRVRNPNAYSYFDWLAITYCPKHLNDYPKQRPLL